MSWFKKPPKVEFLCVDETIQHLYPIVEARKLHPTWFKETTTSYAKELLSSTDTSVRKNIAKCRGIRKLLNTGWVARTWQDIKLKVYEDGSFEWATPIDQTTLDNCADRESVTYHSMDSFSKCEALANKLPILKVQLPWVVKVPNGYNIMQLPITYGDEGRFVAATGIYEPAFGSMMELNIQLLWQAGAGEFLIKAGTPLAQFIATKNETLTALVRTITPKEMKVLSAEILTKHKSYCPHHTVVKEQLKQLHGRG